MNKTLQPHQLRVLDEAEALKIKLDALQKFLLGKQPAFISDAEWDRLQRQEKVMNEYHSILVERIAAF